MTDKPPTQPGFYWLKIKPPTPMSMLKEDIEEAKPLPWQISKVIAAEDHVGNGKFERTLFVKSLEGVLNARLDDGAFLDAEWRKIEAPE